MSVISEDGHALCETCGAMCALWSEGEYEGHYLRGWIPLMAADPIEGVMECPVDRGHTGYVFPSPEQD